jgi:DNA-binding MarR family transcriptional regulator
MNAYLTEVRPAQFGADRSPVLIAGTNQAALDRAASTVTAAGLRIADQVGLAAAPDRIAMQVAASAVWLELDDDDQSLDRLLHQVNHDVAGGRYRAIVAAPRAMVDPLAAMLGDGDIQLIIDGDEIERVATLGLALAQSGQPLSVSDVASERSAARLRQLSDEVSRIASTLARLSSGPAAAAAAMDFGMDGPDAPQVSAETIASVIRARRVRARFFREDLFADPAWDMLLDLLQAEIKQLRVPVSSLCIAAAVPATTALRWLKTMTQEGLFLRRADPHDGRRVFVELAPPASQALRRYFAEVGRPVTI